jgi:hypothetical protein
LYQYRELLWAYFLGTFNVCFFEKRVGGGQWTSQVSRMWLCLVNSMIVWTS